MHSPLTRRHPATITTSCPLFPDPAHGTLRALHFYLFPVHQWLLILLPDPNVPVQYLSSGLTLFLDQLTRSAAGSTTLVNYTLALSTSPLCV